LTSRYDVAFEHPQFWQRIDAPGLWYTVFFYFIYSNTLTCLATNLWRYLCTSL